MLFRRRDTEVATKILFLTPSLSFPLLCSLHKPAISFPFYFLPTVPISTEPIDTVSPSPSFTLLSSLAVMSSPRQPQPRLPSHYSSSHFQPPFPSAPFSNSHCPRRTHHHPTDHPPHQLPG
ncbi:hypothetical protein OIU74_020175 [Salix koriyanagi]|uniref:Uncharacterized protein n=1 Tax=Salix koriyanagi TaxID=2511006 RepID=A0A9Q0P598_9ROSI|nr:hypothetical protein OIU74_020175 [Salix koriyanagi]